LFGKEQMLMQHGKYFDTKKSVLFTISKIVFMKSTPEKKAGVDFINQKCAKVNHKQQITKWVPTVIHKKFCYVPSLILVEICLTKSLAKFCRMSNCVCKMNQQ
jgi:hypothetical protein